MNLLIGLINKMYKYILLCLLFITSACSTNTPAPIIEKNNVVRINSAIYEECPPLLTANKDNLAEITVQNIMIYAICKDKYNKAIILIKEFSNKE